MVKTADKFYESFSLMIMGGWAEIYSYICERDYLNGKTITVVNDGEEKAGIALGITVDGRLRLDTGTVVDEIETGSIR